MDTEPDTQVAAPSLERTVTRLWPRRDLDALIRAGEAVHSLSGHPGWEAVVRVLNAEVDAIDKALDVTHRALDQADYALKHGRRGGLRAALDAAHAIVSAADRAQREADEPEAAESALAGQGR